VFLLCCRSIHQFYYSGHAFGHQNNTTRITDTGKSGSNIKKVHQVVHLLQILQPDSTEERVPITWRSRQVGWVCCCKIIGTDSPNQKMCGRSCENLSDRVSPTSGPSQWYSTPIGMSGYALGNHSPCRGMTFVDLTNGHAEYRSLFDNGCYIFSLMLLKNMRCVGLDARDPPKHTIKLAQLRILSTSLGRGYFHHLISFPQPIAVAEVFNPLSAELYRLR